MTADSDEEDAAAPAEPADEREVLIDSPLDVPPPASSLPTAVRIGIVTMTKHPEHFESWLRHHHRAVKAVRFYVRVEDATPELACLLTKTAPWDTLVKARLVKRRTMRDWSGQTQRQVTFVEDAIEWAREDGLTHLLHVDDDELLYAAHGADVLHAALGRLPASIFNVHVLTVEALAPTPTCTNPFAEARVLRHRPREYGSYGSAAHNAGKSLGVLRCKRLRCGGPHHFVARIPTGAEPTDPLESEKTFDWTGTHVLPAPVAVIVHYESVTYTKWLRKFCDSAKYVFSGADQPPTNHAGGATGAAGGATGAGKKSPRQGYTFEFYCESLGACRRLLAAQDSGRPGPMDAADTYCRELWARWKLQPTDLSADDFPPLGALPRSDRARGLTLLARPVVTDAADTAGAAGADGTAGAAGTDDAAPATLPCSTPGATPPTDSLTAARAPPVRAVPTEGDGAESGVAVGCDPRCGAVGTTGRRAWSASGAVGGMHHAAPGAAAGIMARRSATTQCYRTAPPRRAQVQ